MRDFCTITAYQLRLHSCKSGVIFHVFSICIYEIEISSIFRILQINEIHKLDWIKLLAFNIHKRR
jgi:hypothetical protein